MELNCSSSSTSGTKKNPKKFKVDIEGNVYCNHDILAISRVVGRRNARSGEAFFCCTLRPKQDYKFFMWKYNIKAFRIEHGRNEQELEIKNLKLQEENKMLKQPLANKKSTWKNLLCLAIIMIGSWIILR
ncbi:hypothetical protein Hanom_Chr00s000006g01613791 [Helianthus anomalus]